MKALETTAAWRCLGSVFLRAVVPVYHFVGGFFILKFFLGGDYTWGYSLRTLVLFLSNLVLGYEFVYRHLQTNNPHWSWEILRKNVMKYSVIPFSAGAAAALLFYVFRYWAR